MIDDAYARRFDAEMEMEVAAFRLAGSPGFDRGAMVRQEWKEVSWMIAACFLALALLVVMLAIDLGGTPRQLTFIMAASVALIFAGATVLWCIRSQINDWAHTVEVGRAARYARKLRESGATSST